MADIGQNLAVLAALDTSLTVASGGAWTAGTSHDFGTTAPQAARAAIQIAISNAGTTDGYDLKVLAQFSDDDTLWPDDGEGTPLGTWFSATAGADLTRSGVRFFVPLLRYARLSFSNANATDNVSVTTEIAEIFDNG